MAARTPRPSLGLVFGSERFGMANADVWRCHVCLSIPTTPGYGSLNLAQALQCMAHRREGQGQFSVECLHGSVAEDEARG